MTVNITIIESDGSKRRLRPEPLRARAETAPSADTRKLQDEAMRSAREHAERVRALVNDAPKPYRRAIARA